MLEILNIVIKADHRPFYELFKNIFTTNVKNV